MGVVYKAEDARLQRFVALKFLSPDLADDPEALTRFHREARAASALNHANICTVYDIGEQDPRATHVMEGLAGEKLKHRITGPDAVPRGLMDAHLRRLRLEDTYALRPRTPRNNNRQAGESAITSGGHVKVVDFGLAKVRTIGGDAGRRRQKRQRTTIRAVRWARSPTCRPSR
jgi:serine/threonine protein kinase